MIKSCSLLIALCLLSISATAATTTFNLNWIPPNQNADGSPLAAEDIVKYRLYYHHEGGEKHVKEIGGDQTEFTFTEEIPAGAHKYSFYMTTVSASGGESSPSNKITKELNVSSEPEPPNLIEINIKINVSKNDDGIQ